MRGTITTAAFLNLMFLQPAEAAPLLENEFFPRPQFSERSLSKGIVPVSARLFTSVGQDQVDTFVNAQTEKRLFTAIGLAAQAGLQLTDKLTVDAFASAIRSSAGTQVEENSGWNKTETGSEVTGRAHARFLWNEGVRFGGGVLYVLRPAAQETFDFAGQGAVKQLSGYSVWTPEFSVVKESSAWSAGLGWRRSARQSRQITREAAGEKTEFSEDVMVDEVLSAGIATQLSGGRTLKLDVNLNSSEAAPAVEGASSNAAAGTENIQRRYEVAALLGLGEFSGNRVSIGTSYQSIGYSDQSNVTPQSIPLWSFVLRDEFRQADLNVFAEGLLGYGTDMQSLPDLNAKYKRLIVSAQAGVQF